MAELHMATKRFENLSQEKHVALLGAARTEFAQNGFDGASLNDILKTAGFSKGQFYYYFEDKADLYGTMLADVFSHFFDDLDIMRYADTPETYWRQLESVVGDMVASIAHQPDLIQLGMGLRKLMTSPGCPPVLAALMERSHTFATMLVGHGRRVGAITTDIPDDLLGGILDGIHEKLDYWSFVNAPRITDHDIELHTRLYVALFRCISELHVSMKPGRTG
jgi:AcrR family transcriptional regulator